MSWNSFPRHLVRFTLGPRHKLRKSELLQLVGIMSNLKRLDIFYDEFLSQHVRHATSRALIWLCVPCFISRMSP